MVFEVELFTIADNKKRLGRVKYDLQEETH